MPYAHILFRVPEDARPVAEILAEKAGESDDIGADLSDAGEIAGALAGRAGEFLCIDYPDEDDPLDVVWDLADAFDKAGVAYWAASDSFTEVSRGFRVEARVLLNLSGAPGGRRDLTIPWAHGEPAFDEATLVAGGMTREEADAAAAVVFTGHPRHPGPA